MAWPVARRFALALLLLFAAHVRDGEGRMSEREFAALLHRFREDGRQLSDEQFHVLYQQVNTMFWSSPDSIGTGASGLDNATYSVILYEIPPFVRLTDFEAVEGDPGNVNQTRTARNGGISGITGKGLLWAQAALHPARLQPAGAACACKARTAG